jgi:activator of 2-hydroxyglutaryl-CoA dehydratase
MELPRHYLLVISIEVGGRDDKAFRIEEGTRECFELCNQGTKLSGVFTVLKLNFDDEDFGRDA